MENFETTYDNIEDICARMVDSGVAIGVPNPVW
jgi:hypothetical protein